MKPQARHILLPLLIGASLPGCATDPSVPGFATEPLAPGRVLTTRAMVQFADLEGGCWALRTQDGLYEPVDLPVSYRINGLVVRVTIRDAPGYASTCMIAPLVRIDSIVGILEDGG